MNVAIRDPKTDKTAPARLGIVDCDIHPSMKTKNDITKYLSERWRKHYDSYGGHSSRPTPDRWRIRACRRTPRAAMPGRRTAVRPAPISTSCASSISTPTTSSMACCIRCGSAAMTSATWIFPAALSTAINDWQIDAWVGPEPRLRASIYVAQDYPEAAVKEIERRADDPRFVQVSCAPQSEAPLGNRRYWPMFAAACARPIVRSRCTSAAFRAIRRPARAGRHIISSTISPTSRRCCRW